MAKKDAKSKSAPVIKKQGSSVAAEPTANAISLFQELGTSMKISFNSYISETKDNQKLRLIDAFLVFLVCLGIWQFLFCLLVGTFPFNAFLGGFIATVAQFVLTVSLRLQTLDTNKTVFKGITPERALGDYIFASLALHFVVLHFIN
ncbi:hypothetical protein KL905_002485 [Ogataea polymorpha]|uniref:Dolichyl-diphosphooligosaccharide--protein glycosyltransferase subunit OST2 n=1 Tax=Ogataea polymorpha TaxID=460523 RepID=A0A9P8T021_9ASCO|nr:hypothetical protein KL937_002073 [Ogataea polymorpha]KAG7894657.1 hypothetical protein KL908_002029 [Ogataea polymorpha]KAG7899749.1 hypothetical protein KL935_003290 [Ogataea polymorpha]KAG7906589.1 hypothetical protein KL907_002229 [Ogataea polymorpha]KAG7909836.1 hypothetical protein KL906_001741 [Ogataea polymorpha]